VDLLQKKKAQEDIVAVKLDVLRAKAKSIGNYVHDTVPVSDNEDNNEIIRKWAPDSFNENSQEHAGLSHHEVLLRLDGYDSERGVKLVGHRGYCLTGYGYFLSVYIPVFDMFPKLTLSRNMALISYGVEFLFQKGSYYSLTVVHASNT
jgi:seryl-tRNA synthetase